MKLTLLPALLLGAVLSFQISAQAKLKVAAIFGNNMVLQQEMRVPVWGWSDPGAKVNVKFAGQTESTRADAKGRWLVKLHKMQASAEPQTMTIQSGETQTLTNVLIGEVWLASGQSNMEKPLGLKHGEKPCYNYKQVLAAANYPKIRLFKVRYTLAAKPLADLKNYDDWRECNSNALHSTKFSAAAYFFGREIHTNLNVPVGLIESSWGGTRIEPWTPPVGFKMVPSLVKFAHAKINPRKISNRRPLAIYNGMIAPLAGYAMRGVIWYQGESNLMGGRNNYDYLTYANKMVALVDGWRAVWHEGVFPFYFVQIAPFKYYEWKFVPSRESLPQFWTLQSQAEHRIKRSGMVVTTDLVNNLNDIHPRDKLDVGHRLALLARHKTYGEKNVVCSGPVFRKAEFKNGRAILSFNHVDGGLMSKDGKPLTWFTIAGPNQKFVPAQAKIVGQTLEVSSPAIKHPVAVRFAWDETAEPNFFNQAGLPAQPFRTDHWKE